MSTHSLLVATKLHAPPVRPGYIRRPRLEARLARGLATPLTLISAPPGCGKTTLAAGWLSGLTGAAALDPSHGLPPAEAWLALDDQDNDLVRFWRYTVAAVQAALPEVGQMAAAMLAEPQPPALETVLATLVNDLDSQPVTLVQVFDDYHLIELPAIHASLAWLLDHAPATLHVVLLTRADPPLSLARRRARDGLTEVRAADLAFSAAETEAFLRERMGLELPSATVALLTERMGGWIAGMQLAALSLPGQADPAAYLAEHVATDPFISDYLLEEVLQQQPDAVQHFLLRTAVCDRFCAELCADLLACDGQPQNAVELGQLERSNLFVAPLDAAHTWYRYQPVFAALLRRHLRASIGGAGVRALHVRAAHWFATHGDLVTAVHHALQANDFALVAEWLEQRASRLFAESQLPELVGWVARLPASSLQARPRLVMAASWATLATGDFNAAERYLDMLEPMLRDGSLAHDADPALAEIEVTVVRMQVQLLREDYDAVRAVCMRLVAQLAALDPQQICLFNTVDALRPVVTYNLAILHEHSGDSGAAEDAYAAAAAAANRLYNVHLALLCLGRLAQLQHVRGALHAALRTAEAARALATQGAAISPLASHAHVQLGQLYYEWNMLGKAAAAFQAGANLAQVWQNWEGLVPCTVGLARLRRVAGQNGAAALLDPLLTQYPDLPPSLRDELPIWQRLWQAEDRPGPGLAATAGPTTAGEQDEERRLLVCRLLLAGGQPQAARRELVQLADDTAAGQRWRRSAAARVLLAKAQVLAGNEAAAFVEVGQALAITEPEQYCRTWLDAGEIVHGLLRRWRERYMRGEAPASALLTYVDWLLAAWESAGSSTANAGETTAGRSRGQALIEPLSPRELETLALLAAGLSNQEIADQLVVSITTVKTHLAAIYRKLDAANRTQAVMYARHLGLLNPTL